MADRRLQVFHAVAKHRSFTRAAEALFMSQPAVTFQVKQLEEEHNTRLFERRHGQVLLTTAGGLLLEYAEKILAMSSEMETRISELSGELRGLFLVGASTSLAESWMPSLLAQFTALHPQVRPRLCVANAESIENRVAEHELDLGMIACGSERAGLVYEACGDDELQVVCAPDYPLSSLKQLEASDLLDYEYVAREPGSGSRRAFDRYLSKHKVDPHALKMLMELGSPAAVKAVLATGLGFSVLPVSQISEAVKRKALAAIPLNPALKRNVHLIFPEGRFRSRMTNTFIDFVKSQTKGRFI